MNATHDVTWLLKWGIWCNASIKVRCGVNLVINHASFDAFGVDTHNAPRRLAFRGDSLDKNLFVGVHNQAYLLIIIIIRIITYIRSFRLCEMCMAAGECRSTALKTFIGLTQRYC